MTCGESRRGGPGLTVVQGHSGARGADMGRGLPPQPPRSGCSPLTRGFAHSCCLLSGEASSLPRAALAPLFPFDRSGSLAWTTAGLCTPLCFPVSLGGRKQWGSGSVNLRGEGNRPIL